MDDQLKQLFDYTKFHIGMYTTLIAGIIGVFANDSLKNAYSGMVPYIKVSIVLFLVAGAAGGLVASSIPFFKTFDEFSQACIGPWKLKLFPAIICTHVEHTAFWFGCFVAAFGLFRVLPS
ncbi:hypothetical protein [Methanothrix soehngenii]|uniref:hypothetical protein n=1 Tax=Methanothrix soehngenii TaxID=2223 RepID=UPI00300C2560